MRLFQRMTTDLWMHGYASPTVGSGERVEVLRIEQGRWDVFVGFSTTWRVPVKNAPFRVAMKEAHRIYQDLVKWEGKKAP